MDTFHIDCIVENISGKLNHYVHLEHVNQVTLNKTRFCERDISEALAKGETLKALTESGQVEILSTLKINYMEIIEVVGLDELRRVHNTPQRYEVMYMCRSLPYFYSILSTDPNGPQAVFEDIRFAFRTNKPLIGTFVTSRGTNTILTGTRPVKVTHFIQTRNVTVSDLEGNIL